MNLREITLEQYNKTNIPDTPMNWHVWKKAFELGWRMSRENNKKDYRQTKG